MMELFFILSRIRLVLMFMSAVICIRCSGTSFVFYHVIICTIVFRYATDRGEVFMDYKPILSGFRITNPDEPL